MLPPSGSCPLVSIELSSRPCSPPLVSLPRTNTDVVGLLLEEFALELLQPHISALEGRSGASASPFMDPSAAAAASFSEQVGGRMLEALGVGQEKEGSGGAGAGAEAEAGEDEAGSSSSEYSS